MANIVEQDDVVLGEGEEFGNIDELVPQKSEEKPEEVAEEVVEEEGESTFIPPKFKGKSMEDIIKSYSELEKEYGRRSNEIGELRRLTDELIKQQLNGGGNATTDTKKKIGVDDLLDDPDTVLSSAIDNNPRLKKLEEKLLAEERNRAKASFEAKYPNAYQTVQEPEFINWIQASPMRTKLFMEANANYDYQIGGELLDLYYSLHNVKVEDAKEVRKAGAEKALKSASVERGSSGQTAKKVYRRQDILNMAIHNKAKYYSDEFQAELAKAYSEGRVR